MEKPAANINPCCPAPLHQNRNSVRSSALLNASINHSITIEQKILEVGHTQMKADSIELWH